MISHSQRYEATRRLEAIEQVPDRNVDSQIRTMLPPLIPCEVGSMLPSVNDSSINGRCALLVLCRSDLHHRARTRISLPL